MKHKKIIISMITLVALVLTVSVVMAAPKPPMGAFWGLVGNSGTNPATNFLGTTDDKDLVIKTNNIERARFDSSGIDATVYTEGVLTSSRTALTVTRQRPLPWLTIPWTVALTNLPLLS